MIGGWENSDWTYALGFGLDEIIIPRWGAGAEDFLEGSWLLELCQLNCGGRGGRICGGWDTWASSGVGWGFPAGSRTWWFREHEFFTAHMSLGGFFPAEKHRLNNFLAHRTLLPDTMRQHWLNSGTDQRVCLGLAESIDKGDWRKKTEPSLIINQSDDEMLSKSGVVVQPSSNYSSALTGVPNCMYQWHRETNPGVKKNCLHVGLFHYLPVMRFGVLSSASKNSSELSVPLVSDIDNFTWVKLTALLPTIFHHYSQLERPKITEILANVKSSHSTFWH